MIEPEVIRLLAEAGVSAVVIAQAIEADARIAAQKRATRRPLDRAASTERQRRKRERDQEGDLFAAPIVNETEPERVTRVTIRDSVTFAEKERSPTPPKEKTLPSELVRTSSSEAAIAAQAPVYSDSRHELWGEGIAILIQLGLSDRNARSNLGRWLRDSGDDAGTVLSAIQRARDQRVIEPIPWVTQALSAARRVVPFPISASEKRRQETANALDELRKYGSGEPQPDGFGSGGDARGSFLSRLSDADAG